MHDATRAYIAGFLDGDGSIIFQLVRRLDYVYGYQIRSSVCFYQHSRGKAGLEWLKGKLGCGSIRDRAGSMSDYTIVGWSDVRCICNPKLLQAQAPRRDVRRAASGEQGCPGPR